METPSSISLILERCSGLRSRQLALSLRRLTVRVQGPAESLTDAHLHLLVKTGFPCLGAQPVHG